MKFYNKKPQVRKNWTKVELYSVWNYSRLKRWCQRYPSQNKFYADLNKWEFESPEDALIFKLKWNK